MVQPDVAHAAASSPAFGPGQVGGADQHDQQVDRDDFKGQQVRHPGPPHRPAAVRSGVGGHAGQLGAGGVASSTPEQRLRRASTLVGDVAGLSRPGLRQFAAAAGCRPDASTASTPNSSRPTTVAMAHSAGPGLHGDERPLGGEHDAEDHQHQRAADVDEQLGGADEVGPEQEEDARGAGQGEQQPGRRADDVLRHHHGDGATARSAAPASRRGRRCRSSWLSRSRSARSRAAAGHASGGHHAGRPTGHPLAGRRRHDRQTIQHDRTPRTHGRQTGDSRR